MLTLFTNITQQLTPLERDTCIPLLLSILKESHDDKRITGNQLCIVFKSQGLAVSGARLLKMVNYIRVMNLAAPAVVIGAFNGYFVTTDIQIIKDQIESIQGRIDAMNGFMDTMKAQLQSLKHQQCNAS